MNASNGVTPDASSKPVKPDRLSALIVTERDRDGESLIRALQRLRVEVRFVTSQTRVVPSDADVVYCDYSADLSNRLGWPTGSPQAALVVLLRPNERFERAALEAAAPNAVLSRPFTDVAIEASLIVACSQFRYEKRLIAKASHLEDSLMQARTIERAKRYIMASRAINEDEAYKFIRTEAMSRRMAVGRVAEAINASFEMFGGDPVRRPPERR